jgi:negative regulator of flagellin synthesis FlgM
VTRIHHGLDVNGPGGLSSGSADKTQAAPGQTAQPQTQPQAGAASQSAEVEITPTAQLLATLEQQIASTPDISHSRVDPISQALSNGSYQIDSSRVADGLLAAQKLDAQAANGSGSGVQASNARAFTDTAQNK